MGTKQDTSSEQQLVLPGMSSLQNVFVVEVETKQVPVICKVSLRNNMVETMLLTVEFIGYPQLITMENTENA